MLYLQESVEEGRIEVKGEDKREGERVGTQSEQLCPGAEPR